MSTPKKQTLNVVESNTHETKAKIKEDSGLVTLSCHLPHGMLFTDKEGTLILTYHTPNRKGSEHPHFVSVQDAGDTIKII